MFSKQAPWLLVIETFPWTRSAEKHCTALLTLVNFSSREMCCCFVVYKHSISAAYKYAAHWLICMGVVFQSQSGLIVAPKCTWTAGSFWHQSWLNSDVQIGFALCGNHHTPFKCQTKNLSITFTVRFLSHTKYHKQSFQRIIPRHTEGIENVKNKID